MKMLVAAILLGTISAAGAANVDNDHNDKKVRWELPADVLGNSNQLSFNQKAGGAWYFMESITRAHFPRDYQLLPNYSALCPPYEYVVGAGIACWWSPKDPAPVIPFYEFSAVKVNFTDYSLPGLINDPPAHTMVLHPRFDRAVLIAWRSPRDQKVEMSGNISALRQAVGCDLGHWSIEQGTTVLASGPTLFMSDSAFYFKKLEVKKNEAIYFIADPSADATTANCGNLAAVVSIVIKTIDDDRR